MLLENGWLLRCGSSVHRLLGADTVDVTLSAPSKPTLGVDSGSSSTDRITNAAAASFAGAYGPGVQVNVYDGGTQLGSARPDADGKWSFTAPGALRDGVHSISIRIVDSVGNLSDASSALVFTVDTQKPTIAVPASIAVVTPPGLSTAKVAFAPTAADNLPGVTTSCSAASGSAFAVGTTAVTCVATDAAGNSTSASFTVTVNDWKLVAKPSRPQLTGASDSGASNTDNLTNVVRPTFAIGAAAGSLVQLLEGSTILGFAYADSTGLALVQIDASHALGDGLHALSARILDATSALSSLSDAQAVTIDTAGPSGSFTINADSTVINGADATNSPFLALGLTFADGNGLDTMEISTDGGATYTPAESYFNANAVTLTGADGLYTVAVRITDLSGNTVVVTKQIRLDRSGPAITDSGIANGAVYDVGTTLTLNFGASDTDGVKTVAATLDTTTGLKSGVAISTDTLTAGLHTVVITATDQLGNVSSVSVTFTIRVTTGGLQSAVGDGVARKQVDASVQSVLVNKLQSAQAAINRGDKTSARNMLNAFISAVSSNSGKKIDAGYAAMLIGWANDVLARL